MAQSLSLTRSDAPSPASSSAASASASASAPPPSLARRALESALAQPATAKSSYSRPGAPPPPSTTPAAASGRAQFEGQQDFISFDKSPSPPPAAARKRARDDYDDRDDEGSRRLQNRERNRSTPWCDHPGVDWDHCSSAIEQLNREARAFVDYISPSPDEHQLRIWTVELIRRTIQASYPDATVECFGSVGTGLYLPGGDIDLVLLSPSLPSPPLKPSSSLLHRLASLLLTSSIALPNSLVVIAKARVPIVKFVTRHGGFAVDLSVNQRGGVDAAVRVRSMLEEYAFREEGYVEPGAAAGALKSKGKGKGKGKARSDSDDEPEEGELSETAAPVAQSPPARTSRAANKHPVDHGVARSLVLLVKAFLAQRGMNEVFTGGLGSYSIICLVISFLQLHPKIQTALVNPNRNLGLLFIEFLELYGKHFNYDQAGITLRGRGGYFNKHDKGWYRPGQPYLLSIEDPNDPQNDVSGGSHAILRVRQTLAGGFDVLSASLCARESLLASSRAHSAARVPVLDARALPNADDGGVDAAQRSLLGSIIGLGAADVAGREAAQALHAQGTLQALLGREANAFAPPRTEKQLKRAKRDAREEDRRARTIARLERRGEEKERKQERKRAKRAAAAAAAEEGGVGGEAEHQGAVQDARVKAADLAPLADVEEHRRRADASPSAADSGGLFIVDTVGAGLAPPAKKKARTAPAAAAEVRASDVTDDDDADDSRYTRLAPPLPLPPAAAARAPVSFTHVTDDSSASSGADDDDEDAEAGADGDGDGDVVLGGSGGDLVRPAGVSRDVTPAATAAAVRGGAPKGKRGLGIKAKKAAAVKEDKARRRNDYWAAKGVKEPGDSDEL
ncbi:hypothetical protein JCM3770_003638 [Rhodotorula araucariae]